MFRNWTFGRKLGGGFAVSAIALAIVAVTGFRSNRTLITNDEWVSHSHLVRRQIAALITHIVDAESGQRGYVLTGRDAFLEPYTIALPAIEKTFAELHQLTADNPNQTRRLEALRSTIDEKLAVLKRALDIRRAESLEAAAAAIAGSTGQTLIDKIRALIGEMDQEELHLLEIRKHDSVSASETTKVVIIWGSLAAI
ncbi:MAG: CHASE3 domain-containing protein, partial [Solirubrobacteraceae bacterium]